MRITCLFLVCSWVLVTGCSRPDSDTARYSKPYRGLAPVSEAQAQERALRMCQDRLGTSNNVATAVLPVPAEVDYFRVLVVGTLGGNRVTNSVLVHRFNPKGDKIGPGGSR